MQQRCPSCGRAWVPGETQCPFCGAPLGVATPSAVAFHVQWVLPNGVLQTAAVSPRGLRVGRGSENDVMLDDRGASRNHAFIWIEGGQCYIRDEGSTNGTFVNGQQIRGPQPLRPGDQVCIGNTTLQLVLAPAPAIAPMPPAPVPVSAPSLQPAPGPKPLAPSERTFTIGRGITIAGVVAITLLFFMPWVSWTLPDAGPMNWSGYQIATIALAERGQEGAEYGDLVQKMIDLSSPFLLIILGAGLLILLLTVISLFFPPKKQWPFFAVQVPLALLVLGLLIWFYLRLSGQGPFTLQVSYWASWGAVILLLLGSALDLVQVLMAPPPVSA